MSLRPLLHAYRFGCTLESVLRPLIGVADRGGAFVLEEAVLFGWPTLAEAEGPSLVLFAGTIGEFNAVRPFIEAYRENWPEDRVILLSGQQLYAEALHRAMPDAVVALPTWRAPNLLDQFIQMARPRLVAYAEGPSLHGRFPIRLELPLSAACLYHRVPLVVLNARVYEENLASRIDRLEHWGFAQLHRDAVARWFAPGDGFKRDLVEAGAPEARISVVGDLKFDNAAAPPEAPPAVLAEILKDLKRNGAPLVVGGSVNAIDDQMCLIAAWRELKEVYTTAKLVIAPRYLQETKVLRDLRAYLDAEGIGYLLRSQYSGGAVEADVMIVDVFGELRFYYGHATICYVGRNHGVLEPLRYHKATVVADDWRRDHPSFPLYDSIVQAGAVVHVTDKARLGEAFVCIMQDTTFSRELIESAECLIDENAGAARRIVAELQGMAELGFG